MHVLNLVTSDDSTFFDLQVRTLVNMGVDCTTVSVSSKSDREKKKNGRRSIVDYGRFYSTAFKQSFGPYDLVHANYGLTAPVAVAQPNLPVVLSLWGSDLMGPFGPLSKVCARFADEVIVMSDEMASKLNQDCNVIPHGVDTDVFKPMSKESARDELGWAREGYHVLFPYRPTRTVKNYSRAERIVDAVRERFDVQVELHTVTGVEHARMPIYMNAADAMLLTSNHEGSPNTVKEALACNLPVVSTDVGDVSDQLHGVSSSAVCHGHAEFVEVLVAILKQDTPSNGRTKVKSTMSTEHMGEQILEVYDRVMN